MSSRFFRCLLPTLLAATIAPTAALSAAAAQSRGEPAAVGGLVSVAVDVEGKPVPLFAAPDGSSRWYLEAAEGAEYAVTVVNRTPERLGVVLSVDGLNAISGERTKAGSWWSRGEPGRMYVLEPWARTTVRGWRTSLEEVRRFTFVDEQASYAARTGQANAKMGWIEVAVHRERSRPRQDPQVTRPENRRGGQAQGGDRETAEDAAQAPSAPPADAGGRDAKVGEMSRSYPGTGWGDSTADRAVLVDFEPERRPAERITVRYEYADALIELGVLPGLGLDGGRLAERDRGTRGFARPPLR